MDRRVIKTKKSIRLALVKLLKTKTLNEITITELSKEADINRKTFYNYYSDITMVIKEIEDNIIEKFNSALKDIHLETLMSEEKIRDIFMSITQVVYSDLEYHSDLLTIDNKESIILKISESLKNHIRYLLKDDKSIPKDVLNMIIEYSVSGMISVYRYWISNGYSVNTKEFSDHLSTIFYSGLNGIQEEVRR